MFLGIERDFIVPAKIKFSSGLSGLLVPTIFRCAVGKGLGVCYGENGVMFLSEPLITLIRVINYEPVGYLSEPLIDLIK